MSNNLNAGDLAIVIPGKGANNVRNKPNGAVKGQIPEHAVLAILPYPADWTGAYPHDDGVHVWWYVRGRTEKKLASDQFEVIEGWTAASERADPFLMRMETAIACRDTMGTALDTFLQTGQQAYVLPPDGLIIRKEADPQATLVGGLLQGTIVTMTGVLECDAEVVSEVAMALNLRSLVPQCEWMIPVDEEVCSAGLACGQFMETEEQR